MASKLLVPMTEIAKGINGVNTVEIGGSSVELLDREEIDDEDHLLEIIDKLTSHGSNVGDVKKLQDAENYLCNGLMMHTKTVNPWPNNNLLKNIQSLIGMKGLSEANVDMICEAAKKIVIFGDFTGNDVLLRIKIVLKITTKNQALDAVLLLGGGIETLQITKAFGKLRSGKTHLAHTLCVSTQFPNFTADKAYVDLIVKDGDLVIFPHSGVRVEGPRKCVHGEGSSSITKVPSTSDPLGRRSRQEEMLLKREMGRDTFKKMQMNLKFGIGETGIKEVLNNNPGKNVLVIKRPCEQIFEIFISDDNHRRTQTYYFSPPDHDVRGYRILDARETWLLLGMGNIMFHYGIATGESFMLPPIDEVVPTPVAATFQPTSLTIVMWRDARDYHIWLHREGRNNWEPTIERYTMVNEDMGRITGIQMYARGERIEIIAIDSNNQFLSLYSDGSPRFFGQIPREEDYADVVVAKSALIRDPMGAVFYLGIELDTSYYYTEVAPEKIEGRHGRDITAILVGKDILLVGQTGFVGHERGREGGLSLYMAEGRDPNAIECLRFYLTEEGSVEGGSVIKECITYECDCSFGWVMS